MFRVVRHPAPRPRAFDAGHHGNDSGPGLPGAPALVVLSGGLCECVCQSVCVSVCACVCVRVRARKTGEGMFDV